MVLLAFIAASFRDEVGQDAQRHDTPFRADQYVKFGVGSGSVDAGTATKGRVAFDEAFALPTLLGVNQTQALRPPLMPSGSPLPEAPREPACR